MVCKVICYHFYVEGDVFVEVFFIIHRDGLARYAFSKPLVDREKNATITGGPES